MFFSLFFFQIYPSVPRSPFPVPDFCKKSNATSTSSEGGEVSLAAVGDINAGNIESSGSLRGGNIQVRSSGGAIATSANLDASSLDGIGGEVNFTAVGEVVTGNVTTAGDQQGGDITLTSETANVDTTAGELDATSSGGSDGNIVINAAENISIRNINIEEQTTYSPTTPQKKLLRMRME